MSALFWRKQLLRQTFVLKSSLPKPFLSVLSPYSDLFLGFLSLSQ